jgi:hypothetical protein
MISVSSFSPVDYTTKFIKTLQSRNNQIYGRLDNLAKKGVNLLAAATPTDTGETAKSWDYKIIMSKNEATIVWTNDCVENDLNVAILIQYGHGTKSGAIVPAVDFINPALKPLYDSITLEIWTAITSS